MKIYWAVIHSYTCTVKVEHHNNSKQINPAQNFSEKYSYIYICMYVHLGKPTTFIYLLPNINAHRHSYLTCICGFKN